MKYIFYDTETTGLEAAFDQILQFAAIVTDDDFNVLEEIDLRCRLQPHVLPSPGAMVVTGIGPTAIQQAPHSCYEMICEVRRFIERQSPAVIVGFNSISYDEKMLRQAFYQHLHPVYATNTKGNTRMDILVLAHAVAAWRPDAIKLSLNAKGKQSFKLVDLMEANGLAMGNAHDAHADTRATIDLARFLKAQAPDIWDDVVGSRSKALVIERLEKEKIVHFTDRMFKKPTILGAVICSAPGNTALHALFDLEYDPTPFLGMDLAQAKKILKASPRPIRLLRANNLPIIRTWDGSSDEVHDSAKVRQWTDLIAKHPTFSSVISEAIDGLYEDDEPSDLIEEQIFGGFPNRADEAKMLKFHKAPWNERHQICLSFEDQKYRQFGERLIFADYPAGLPTETRAGLEKWCKDRHLTEEECRWLTKGKALEQLSKLQADPPPGQDGLLNDIQQFYARIGL